MIEDNEAMEEYKYGLAGSGMPFLIIVYNGLCMKVFDTFECTELLSGDWILSVAPETTCEYGDGTYVAKLVVSCLCFFVYVIGIPAGMLGLLYYGMQIWLHSDPCMHATHLHKYIWMCIHVQDGSTTVSVTQTGSMLLDFCISATSRSSTGASTTALGGPPRTHGPPLTAA